MNKLPPKCPHCKKRLFEAFENEYNTYVFNAASAMYKLHKWKAEIEILCSYRDGKLYDVFPMASAIMFQEYASSEHRTCEEKSIRRELQDQHSAKDRSKR